MCNCQDKIRKEIRESLFDEGKKMAYLLFDTSSIKRLSIKNAERRTGQRVEFKYSLIDKKGVEKQKTEKSFVSHEFCPWCGRKYDLGKKSKQ